MGIRDILVIAFSCACVPLAMVSAYLGLLAYCVLSFLSPQSLAWSDSVQSMRFVLVVGIILIVRAVTTPGPKIRLRGPSAAFVGFWAWAGVSAWFSSHVDLSGPEFLQFCKIGIAAVLITGLVRTRSQLKWLIVVLALCPGIWAAKYGQFFLRGYHRAINEGPAAMDSNDTALFISLSIPMLVFCAAMIRNRLGKAALYVSALLAVPGVILTTSRGGMLAMAAAIALTVWRKTSWLKALAIGCIALVIILAIIPSQTRLKYSSIQSYKEDPSALGRILAWQTSLAMARERPFTGVGFGQDTFLSEYANYQLSRDEQPRAAHSVWFSVLGETGYVGLALYLAMLTSVLRSTQRVMKLSLKTRQGRRHWAWNSAAAIQCAMLSFAVGGTFLSQARFEYIFVLCMTAVPLANLAQRELGTTAEEITTSAAPAGRRHAKPKLLPQGG